MSGVRMGHKKQENTVGMLNGKAVKNLTDSDTVHIQGVPSQNVFFKRAKNVRKSICR